MWLIEIGAEIEKRRDELGLSLCQLARLSGNSVPTIRRLEAGTLRDIGYQRLCNMLALLGLSFGPLTLDARKRKNGLRMATGTTNISYKYQLSEDELRRTLKTGTLSTDVMSNICHFLEETPLSIVVMAVEEASSSPEERSEIWRNIGALTILLKIQRYELQLLPKQELQ